MTEEAGTKWYRATVHGKRGNIKLMLGTAASDEQPNGYTLVIKGTDYAMYYNETPEANENISAESKAYKMIIDGQLRIIRGDKVFDATGRQL